MLFRQIYLVLTRWISMKKVEGWWMPGRLLFMAEVGARCASA